jgi:hypothetical protein
VDDRSRRPRTRWTPRARLLAVSIFILLGLAGFAAALMSAICDQPSLDCLQNEGKDAVRIAVVTTPFIVYAAHRITRGRGPQ